MSGPRLSAFQKDEIVRLVEAGVRNSVIAKQFEVDTSYPRVLARRRGLPARVEPPIAVEVRLWPQQVEILDAAAREERCSRDILIREALSAYLGISK